MRDIGTGEQQVKRLLIHLQRGHSDVILGPVRLGNENTVLDGSWYFVCVSADADGIVSYDSLSADEYEFAEELRSAVLGGLVSEEPLVVHDVDDELQLVRLAATLWPSEKTHAVRYRVEQELGADQSASRQ